MTNEKLTVETSKRICDHMNQDHKEALLKYAIHYGQRPYARTSEMIDLNSFEMTLKVNGEEVSIPFDHKLTDSQDAHKTLINMLRCLPGKS
tara:strand:+ start:111 stop:383 length:273 start_codon:yes stop_codon:yes gene_type:complete